MPEKANNKNQFNVLAEEEEENIQYSSNNITLNTTYINKQVGKGEREISTKEWVTNFFSLSAESGEDSS